ncbi:lanthionine synthetase LanC family protein [Marivirga arenosa]|uniref:Lanthionine synthetase LanC family protein n=1 Tax=Marivirga arenosa TaxID=3059076 RepID=A0AA49JD40_9BACT|nr:lanthionine synthetase LanC family protein [Marivirga sp. BKB1-2]WKK81758.2 lanthionine synthetase LanC family protein [Marivirga sp. BKB1-2]
MRITNCHSLELNDCQNFDELSSLIDRIEKAVDANIFHLNNGTISHGWLGASMFYFYYAQFKREAHFSEKAEIYLSKALKHSSYKYYENKYPTDSYDANLACLGIFLNKASENNLLNFDPQEYLESIEAMLHQLCRNKIKFSDFSIFSGALATGNFLLNTSPSENNNILLTQIVNAIEANAISDDSDGIYWSSPRLYDRIYLGLSHGSCMIISFLSDVYARGLAQEKCKKLINGAINFVLKHKSNNLGEIFPHFIHEKKLQAQFTLCYGDLGVGYSLLKAAKILADRSVLKEANEILRACNSIKFESMLTFDASITYGASGIALLYERLARLEPKNLEYWRAYQYWMEVIPRYSLSENSYCGFQSHFATESDIFNLSYDWGIMGIGITLMRYLDGSLPDMEGISRGI